MTVKEIMADNERLRASSADEVLSLRQEIRELLAALQAMVRAYGNHDDAHTREVRAEAKAAVARAKA
jgi:hypothetical protein